MQRHKVFAANLKHLIERHGKSASDFAHYFAFSRQTISRWLDEGLVRPDKRTAGRLERMAEKFGVRYQDLWSEGLPTGNLKRHDDDLLSRWSKEVADRFVTTRLVNNIHPEAVELLKNLGGPDAAKDAVREIIESSFSLDDVFNDALLGWVRQRIKQPLKEEADRRAKARQ